MFAEFFTPEQIAILTQIIFIDLVLAGDNAIIIFLTIFSPWAATLLSSSVDK